MKTFGADPEFMIVKDGEVKSAIGIVTGSKDNRVTVSGHQFFYDNVLAECAIKPSKSKSQTIRNFKQCLKIYSEMVSPFQLKTKSSHDFPKKDLKHPHAREVGCEPEWCAYQIKQMPSPKKEIKESSFRTCGGHIHIGDKSLLTDSPDPYRAIYLSDLLLAIPSLWLDDDPDSAARRSLYGQAGRYRTKEKYGIEYRSLSNFWLQSPSLVGWVYDVCEFIIEQINNGKAEEMYPCDIEAYIWSDNKSDAWTFPYDQDKLQKAINESDKNIGSEFLNFAKSILPNNLWEEFERLQNQEHDLYNDWF